MSSRSISPDLVAALKRLRLGGLLPTLVERFSLAEKEDTPYEDLLLMLLVDEISRRDSTASIRRADVAGLDPDMVLERWDKSAKVTYDRREVDPVWWTPTLSEKGVEKVPHVGEGNEAGQADAHAGIQG